jgi:hypothetical protein
MDGVRDEKGRYIEGHPGGPGRPPGSKNKLSHLEPRAIQAIKNSLEDDNLSAAFYVYDRINGKEPNQLTVNLPEMKTLLEILHGFPDALRAVQAKFLPEANDALPDPDPAA